MRGPIPEQTRNRDKLKDFFKRPFGDDSDAPIPSEIIVVSPYISRDALEDALSPVEDWGKYPQITIICSWRTSDLVSGASDIGVYETCRDKGWKLRVNSDRSTRKIHLKAYLAHYHLAGTLIGRGMIGSANLTNSGLDSNVEYLHPVETVPIDDPDPMVLGHYNDYFPGREPGSPSLLEAIASSMAASLEVDDEAYESMKEHLEAIGPMEREKLPNWEPPEPVADLSDLAEHILTKMPPRPSLRDLMQVESIDRALNIRGLRFGETRAFLRDKLPKDTTREELNQKTNQVIQEIVQSKSDFDIQKRYGTDCLVWKIHHTINKEIQSQLEPYIGSPLRELGLEESLWDESAYGPTVAKFCLSKLTPEITIAISNLRTSDRLLRLGENGKPLNPTPIGPRIELTDPEGNFLNRSPELMLPEDKLRNSLWLPSFCIFEAPSGAKMKDALLLGFGLWESNHKFIQDLESDLHDDIRILSAQELPFTNNPFTGHPRKVIFTKIAHGISKPHLPLGHPDRKMGRYFTSAALTSITQEILSHDH